MPEQMTPQDVFDPRMSPSAHPVGGLLLPRVGTEFLCRHCMTPAILHRDAQHIAEPYPGGQRTPGVSADVEDGRARNHADITRYGRS